MNENAKIQDKDADTSIISNESSDFEKEKRKIHVYFRDIQPQD